MLFVMSYCAGIVFTVYTHSISIVVVLFLFVLFVFSSIRTQL